MINKFSKPSGDVSREWQALLDDDLKNFERSRRVAALLPSGSPRNHCLLCGQSLHAQHTGMHREVPYFFCPQCGHVQSARLPPPDHEAKLQEEIPFHAIYKPMDPKSFQSRVERIYRPKLDWILDAAPELGIGPDVFRKKRWLELGSGAGFFLKALADAGCIHARGMERDQRLVEMAHANAGHGCAIHFEGSLSQGIRLHDADIYAAFFVLEHVDDLPGILEALREKPSGTLFAFAVPVFGFGAALESAVDGFYPRNLDSAVHTQLFTDASILHMLKLAEYRPVSQWIFGQDATDLVRMLSAKLQNILPEEFLIPFRQSLAGLQDEWQAGLDRNLLSDSRHVLAVRR